MYNSITIHEADEIYAYAFDSTSGEVMVNFTINEEGDSTRLHLTIPFDVVMGMAPRAITAARENEEFRAARVKEKADLTKAADAVLGEKVPA